MTSPAEVPTPSRRGRTPWGRAARARRDNVLRRRTDRQRDLLAVSVVIASLVTVVLSVLAALSCYQVQRAVVQHEKRLVHQVQGVALGAAEPPASLRGASYTALVRWVDATGTAHEGRAAVPPGTDAGGRVRLWLDGEGHLTAALVDNAVGDSVALGGVTFLVLGSAVAAAAVIGRVRLRRIDEQAWEQEWNLVEPVWTHRR